MQSFTQPNSLTKVAEFHTTFNHPVNKTPVIPSLERCILRVNLLQEELNELKQALENKDIVEVADALGDLEYVLSGAVIEFGLGDSFNKCFDLIHESNMSKACDTEEQALLSIDFYKTKKIECIYEIVNGKYVLYRLSDRKIMKSLFYKPVDLTYLKNG